VHKFYIKYARLVSCMMFVCPFYYSYIAFCNYTRGNHSHGDGGAGRPQSSGETGTAPAAGQWGTDLYGPATWCII
jgi:hypothetical protein